MIALLSPGGAFRDVFLSLGLGLFMGLFYCGAKILFGSSRLACIIIDITTFIVGGVMFRSAAAGVFEGGTMRWYTALSAFSSYFMFVLFCVPFVLYKVHVAKLFILKPLKIGYSKFLAPILIFLSKKVNIIVEKIKYNCTKLKKSKKIKKNNKRHLQNQGKMLYNS